jgi:hypothetical protein
MSTIVTVALALGTLGGSFGHSHGSFDWSHGSVPRILPPGPGDGWGFPNNNPDGYGWFDFSTWVPLGPDRTAEYYFPRHWSIPVDQAFLPTYYNPYVSRGQRYLAYANCGGWHPAGGPPGASAELPLHPYNDTIGTGPRVEIPSFTGRVEAPPINSGGTGLTP